MSGIFIVAFHHSSSACGFLTAVEQAVGVCPGRVPMCNLGACSAAHENYHTHRSAPSRFCTSPFSRPRLPTIHCRGTGHLEGVRDAVRRGRMLRCKYCGE